MFLKEILPGSSLRDFVRFYRIIDFSFPDKSKIPSKAYVPRPEHCLQFFSTPQYLGYDNNKKITVAKHSLLAGQHTVLNNRTFYDDLLSFQIVFQPGTLYRLLGMPVTEFTNRVIAPEDVFGTGVEDFCDQLYHANDYMAMIHIAERFMMKRILMAKKDTHPIDGLVAQMLSENTRTSLDWFIDNACLSHRQFDRKFLERTGIPAKEFMRVIRFYKAYLLKNQFPERDWLAIALQCGYYDYQHLSRDYKEFTGYTPRQFFMLDSPERTLGKEEVYQ